MSKREGKAIFVRLSADERALLDQAAALQDQPVATWARSTLLRKARRAIEAVKGRPTNG